MTTPNTNALRRRAEEYLKKACETTSSEQFKEDALTLVHELHVYQIELEMQHEEMRRAQEELKASRNRYAELYNSIPVGYFIFDAHGTIQEVNPAGAAMLKRPQDHLVAKRFQLMLESADRATFTDLCKRVLDQQERFTCEVSLARTPLEEALNEDDHGEERRTVWIEASPFAHGPEAGRLVQAAVVDITERKVSERRLERQEKELRISRQALQEANAKVLRAQDEERRVIARELHDDCCQQLALLIITANSLQTLANQPLAKKLRAMAGQLKRVLDSIRQVAYGLHPAMWETTSIEEACRGYIRDFTAVTQLHVSFTSQDVPAALPQNITTCLFRTLQETLHNVIKYAEASDVHIHLARRESFIDLTVKDNGKGFDLKSGTSARGLGFISMEERVRLLQGSLDIHSRPGLGTAVHVSLPLQGYS